MTIRNLALFRDCCLLSDDCLDAIVAAVVACLWATDPSVFWCPSFKGSSGMSGEGSGEKSSEADAVALLEGWLYAPVFLRPPDS